MVAQLLLINPIETNPVKRRKKGAKNMAKKRASAKQVAARRKFAKMAKARAKAARRKTAKRSTKKSSSKALRVITVTSKRSNKVGHPLTKRGRMRRMKKKIKGYYPNPIRRRRAHGKRRRNPLGGLGLPSYNQIMNNMIMPSAMGAVGAVAIDAVWGYMPIPANWKTGNIRYATKAVGIVGLGWLASKVVSKQKAEAATVGALTVLMYGGLREVMAKFAPNIKLGDAEGDMAIGMYSPGMIAGSDGEYESFNGDESGMDEYQMAEYETA